MTTLIIDVSIYGVIYLNNINYKYYWSLDKIITKASIEIIYCAKPTKIIFKNSCNNFIEVINYFK